MKKNVTKWILRMATLLVAMPFATAQKKEIQIVFDHRVGDKILQLDTAEYTNALGQQFRVSMFKYYIGHITLTRADGVKVTNDSYYLVNEDDPDSKKIVLHEVPAGEYTSIDFIVGVDSADNCTGVQSGALDPVHAMFWAWNTGYIFMKLEGTSPASKSPGRIFEYHIGGYKAPANCIIQVTLPVEMTAGSEHDILHIKADVATILSAEEKIDFAKYSSVTDFHNATMIADNYRHMFSVESQ